jgi:UDP-N-acetyl-D-mannosaminuronic acid dehydrogenase
VDPWFIVDSAPQQARLIRTAREVNDSKPQHVLAQVKERIKGKKQPIIACLGLSFKPDIDDLRESPALEIVEQLAKEKAGTLLVVEPHIEALPPRLSSFPHVKLVELEEALKQSQVILLLVNHRVFTDVDRKLIKGKEIIDTRGVWR